jgi:hypothetical protein
VNGSFIEAEGKWTDKPRAGLLSSQATLIIQLETGVLVCDFYLQKRIRVKALGQILPPGKC